MPAAESHPLPPITLDQWIALNEEIAALVRAGVPLEQGLADLASDLPGGLGRFSAALAAHLEKGASLAEVLDQERGNLPPLYRAVIEAGVRSGRLSVVLESLAAMSRRLVDARRAVAGAFLYPTLVMLVAWGLLVFYVLVLAPNVAATMRSFDTSTAGWLTGLAHLAPSAPYWALVPPLLILLLAAGWYFYSSRPAFSFGWVPWLGSMVRWLRVATFADTLAVLVDSQVPLDEGLELAGAASGDQRLAQSGHDMAQAVRRGETLGASSGPGALPPMLEWLMATGQARGSLPTALRHAAQTYRSRATRRATLIRVVMPVLLTVLLGGTVTIGFGCLVFSPWISMLHKLAAM